MKHEKLNLLLKSCQTKNDKSSTLKREKKTGHRIKVSEDRVVARGLINKKKLHCWKRGGSAHNGLVNYPDLIENL